MRLFVVNRRTSTPHSEADGSEEKHVITGNGTTILAFDTKTERTVHKGSCMGEYKHPQRVLSHSHYVFFLVWIDCKTLPPVIRPKSPGQHCVRRDGHEDRTTGDNHRVDAQVEVCVPEAGRGRTDTGGKGRRQIHETSKTPPAQNTQKQFSSIHASWNCKVTTCYFIFRLGVLSRNSCHFYDWSISISWNT